ncbi:hypothetical protein [Terrihalobacillus insolitus]|uniref:hypothetical protein n=1 Tax=Terrihalobacillus insolitus TaxID=2950438 RepID=UPI00234267FB|nr:hypothetical protein [Terrihalobacillus insolitus]MDC3412515.1 hypothetical protein [Terrihalobacillus insolitus]
MLLRKDGEWSLYPHEVTYTQNGIEQKQWALPSKKWWEDFTSKWDHTNIVGFQEIALTEEQLARFEEIKAMPDDFQDAYTEYILNGNFVEDFPKEHPFYSLRLENENKQLKQLSESQQSAINFLLGV